ncbi:hypothetical protein [Streptomyces antarcticus]|uniref:hypothetical protein n=1 Tax=Streptomyces antarcticus TaxID=2996458 RepID=UPI00226FCEE8|nr:MULTISPECIES: hypothetical protein [unclassified Streptomyces]MCY0947535.1 hypothetical protein [Streptomyces sp. H34-AA3]MCZ4087186.1 hypothetical protein [Streptomyces sp. H34-S5]
MSLTRTPSALLALAVLAAFAVGCGPDTDGGPAKRNSTMNMQQGAERADAILQETLAAVRPELRWNHGPAGDAGCTDAAGGATGTGAADRSVTILTIVSEQRRGALLGIIERAWKDRGYTITDVRPSASFPAIYASTPDGYSLVAKVAGEGQFFMEAATPCLEDHPVQEPTTKPNTPVRTTPYPQRPDVRDDFWSATTPLPPATATP